MPDHHQAAKSQAGQKKTPEVDQTMVFRRKHEVVHAKKTPDGSGAESRQHCPQQQKYQMIPQVKHQQTDGEGVVDLAEKGHFLKVLSFRLKVVEKHALGFKAVNAGRSENVALKSNV